MKIIEVSEEIEVDGYPLWCLQNTRTKQCHIAGCRRDQQLGFEPGRLQQTGDASSEGVKAVTGRRTEESMNAMKVVKDLEKFTGQVDIKMPGDIR